MAILNKIYGNRLLSLLMDQYQLTAAYVLWKNNLHNTQTCFHLFHRKSPFGGGYAICAGLEYVIDWVRNFRIRGEDADFLYELTGNDGTQLFKDKDFFTWLWNFRFTCKIDAVPEGTIVFPHEPMLRVTGSVIDCLFLESFALCTINSQTLFATLASRICNAAKAPVLDGGLRRAQGIDGAISATRAAYIGGIAGTSNLLAGKLLGIKTGGTMQHAYVMLFDDESEAFDKYAEALPNNCTFLVDTYNTVAGIENAIKTIKNLRDVRGHVPAALRLDSGDLADLSKKGRALLDQAGLFDVKICASNDLDEFLIESLKHQGSHIVTWIVGTKLITANDQPALGGVYKLGCIQKNEEWIPKIKLSEQAIKTSNPGILNTIRYMNSVNDKFVGDMIYDERRIVARKDFAVSINNPMIVTDFCGLKAEHLLKPVFRYDQLADAHFLVDENAQLKNQNDLAHSYSDLNKIRERAKEQLSRLDDSVKRLDNPQEYFVGLQEDLYRQKVELVESLR